MVALTTALAPEFGQAKVFRPYRDVRFAKDKTPYKDHQGAFVETGPSTGLYVQVGAPGVFVGAGYYHPEAQRLAAIRRAVADDRTGPELERILAALDRRGLGPGRGAAQDGAPRLRRRPPADRPAAPQDPHAAPGVRLRAVRAHRRPCSTRSARTGGRRARSSTWVQDAAG